MVTFLFVGKTSKDWAYVIQDYKNRISRYSNVKVLETKDIKSLTDLHQQNKKEALLILSNINSRDFVVLMDSGADQYTSVEFADFIEKSQINYSNIVFVVGGAYGFDKSVYERANKRLSLSKMTFTHQMVRFFLMEQVYRAYSILNNNPYHH